MKQRGHISGKQERTRPTTGGYLEPDEHGTAADTMVWCHSDQIPQWPLASEDLSYTCGQCLHSIGGPSSINSQVGQGFTRAQQVNPGKEMPILLICLICLVAERAASDPKEADQ